VVQVIVRNVSKSFGRKMPHLALSNISITAEDGEFLVLLGPSGSGKTTLLRAVAGLEQVDAGEIEIGGRKVNDVDPGQRNVGMVFQDYALYPHLSVRQNISYNMKLRRVARADIERRVGEVARMLGIDELLARRPAELSGGQRQRVAVARAITRDASVLLMDEPLSNLDAQIREHVRVELRELQRRIGVTTIYVTHDQVEAMVLADRIAVMANGAIEQIGTADNVYGRPATLFCARFVGSPKVNEIAGSLTRTETRTATFSIAGRSGETPLALELELESAPTHQAADRCVLVFRPEDCRMMPESLASVPITPTLVENRGSEKYFVAALAEPWRHAQISADLRLKIADQNQAPTAFLPGRIHLFDHVSGTRIAAGHCVGASGCERDRSLAEHPGKATAAR
jgi:multiple sugar transport system ATP-binding protein